MTAILVLFTVIACLAFEFIFSRRKVGAVAVSEVFSEPACQSPRTDIVAGFELPAGLSYHPGHTWALRESPDRVRIGIDQFAAKLIGQVQQLTLPQRGQWIRQGQKIWTVQRDGVKAEMVSPIEGIVTEINDAVIRQPALALQDPYGEGWLMMVRSPDAKTNLRNLLSGTLARSWIQDASERLRAMTPALAGLVLQDGGLAVSDISAQLPDQDWTTLTREFFLC